MVYRRDFIKTSTLTAVGMATGISSFARSEVTKGFRVGMIGLDTSHCIAFTKALNSADAGDEFGGYKVVAAYPTSGSEDIPASIDRLAKFTEQVAQQGVEIVDSINELLKKVDVVLLETVDGRKHLEQAMPVLKAGKRMFIDKPMAASLADAVKIFDAADLHNVPVFSSSSLRYIGGMEDIKSGITGKITGANTYSPAIIEEHHPDLFWYGIHGVEILFTIMGTGCVSVTRTSTPDADMVAGIWSDNRLGTFRGIRAGKRDYGGIVFGEKENRTLGPYNGYNPLLKDITRFFDTGIPPVEKEETLEILAFMEAADISKADGGVPVSLQSVMEKVR